MVNEFLKKNINDVYATKKYKNHNIIPAFVEVGFGQVEPNHLSAQRTSQVYAQLPAAADIEVLQQGQFVKYDYARGEVNFGGDTSDGLPAAPGEWMLVYNEIKLYREFQNDCEFAMIKDNYNARVYSPFGGSRDGGVDVVDYYGQGTKQTRYYGGTFAEGAVVGGQATIGSDGKITFTNKYVLTKDKAVKEGTTYYTLNDETNEYTEVENPTDANIGTYYVKAAYTLDKVTVPGDMYEPHYNDDPFHIAGLYAEKMMKEGTKMVPRVFKTNVGDIFTTNTIDVTADNLELGMLLAPRADDGILVAVADADANTTMRWQVVKVYTMPDHQRGVKIMRIA